MTNQGKPQMRTAVTLVVGIVVLGVGALFHPLARAALLSLPPAGVLLASAERMARFAQALRQAHGLPICPLCGGRHEPVQVSRLMVGLLAVGLWLEGRGRMSRKLFYKHLGFDLGAQVFHRAGGAAEQPPRRRAWLLALAILTLPRVVIVPATVTERTSLN
jgi:hypothetical protein